MTEHYVVDTSVYIDFGRLRLGEFTDRTPVLTAVTLAELAFGLGLGNPTVQAERDRLYREALDLFEILPFGVEEAKIYGVLATLVRAVGRNPRPRRLDLQIAATAAAAKLPLVTCNPDDFVGIDRLVDVIAVEPAS
ncbi:PIN domain-containing protein [Pseudonocardia sp. TRM90224]|uniref:PIN domain-containing protein n=1 Tax=Pseudonocardia sp. TRM90224 TaxID=2812678 RepID=UPI001E3D656D|nr:PIN domain-containing protein [Pseudonocardia sp. TRM90224]